MKSKLSSRRGILGVAAIGGVAAALLLGSLTPANAAGTPNPAAKAPSAGASTKVENTQMGAEIRAHEHVSPNVAMTPDSSVLGLDVSSYQGSVNWSSVAGNGAKFAYVKATESNNYTNPDFTQQYNGSYSAGLIRGAYHFAHPNATSGSAQADYFIAHGGGWSADGKTLPGALDIEWNPSGADCYGLSQSSMAGWISSFLNEYHAKEGAWPVVYTATSWWSECVGTSGKYSSNDPLWIANYNGSPGTLAYNWGVWSFWQSADSGTFPGDQDQWNGTLANLQTLAKNG